MITMTLNEGQGQPFSQTWKGFTLASFQPSWFKFGQVASEKKSLKFLAYIVTVTLNEGQGQPFSQTWKGFN